MEQYKIYFRQVIRIVIILVILLFIWHVGKDWLRPRIIKGLGGYTARDIKETIDTLETKRDTVWLPKKERVVDASIKAPVVITSEILSSSIKGKSEKLIIDSINKINPETPVYSYSLPVNDTLIEGYINTTSTGKIITQRLIYTLKMPMFVKETITIEKTKQETLYDKPKSYFGAGITGTTSKTVGGLILYQTPKKIQYQIGYNRSLENSLISNTNKGIVSISLIKLF